MIPFSLIACSEFQHIWRTIKDEKRNELDKPLFIFFLAFLSEKLNNTSSGTWEISVADIQESDSAGSKIPSKEIFLVRETIASWGPSIGFSWNESTNMFDDCLNISSSASGLVWMEICSFEERSYLLADQAPLGFSCFRSGIFQESTIRVLAKNRQKQVELIDEFKKKAFLEWDIMVSLSLFHCINIRRLARLHPAMEKPVEWVMAPLSQSREGLNQFPPDITRHYLKLKPIKD